MATKLKRTVVVLTAVVVLALAAAVLGWRLYSENSMPSYGGLTAEEWLPQVSGTNSQAALKAFHEMGPQALPFLVRAMGRKDTKRLNLYARIYPKLPGWMRKGLKAPRKTTPIAIVWPCAEAALLHDPDAHSALPALARDLNDPGIWTHAFIAEAIVKLAKEGDSDYVRDLVKGLHDRDPHVRHHVEETLEIIGAPAKEIVPLLKADLNNPSPEIRIEVAWALWNLAQETNACRDALLGAIRAKPSKPFVQVAIFRLREIDPQNPEVVALLKDPGVGSVPSDMLPLLMDRPNHMRTDRE